MSAFKWRHSTGEVILCGRCAGTAATASAIARSWEMLGERGVAVDHTTIYRWVQRYALELEKRTVCYRSRISLSWRVDETRRTSG